MLLLPLAASTGVYLPADAAARANAAGMYQGNYTLTISGEHQY